MSVISLGSPIPMALAAPTLHQQLLCSYKSKIILKPWLPRTTAPFIHFRFQKNMTNLSFISFSSSTSQSSEANTETAESCVNLGLQLFSKGRVCSILSSLLHPLFCFLKNFHQLYMLNFDVKI